MRQDVEGRCREYPPRPAYGHRWPISQKHRAREELTMTPPRLLDTASLPGRLALCPPEAARALGVGLTTFAATILPELRVIRHGRRVIVPVTELTRWLDQNGESVAATIGARR